MTLLRFMVFIPGICLLLKFTVLIPPLYVPPEIYGFDYRPINSFLPRSV